MVSPIAPRPFAAPQVQAPLSSPAQAGAGPGKSGQSVGHRAKAAIAEATRLDFSPNIQGKIASMMARHINVTAVLSPGEPPPPPIAANTVEDVPADDAVADPVPTAAEAVAEDAAVLLTADATEPPAFTS